MLFRAIALSVALLIGIGAVASLTTDYAEAGSHKNSNHKKKKYKKYSKRWWRAYHRRQKRQRELAARKRSLRLRQIRLAGARKASPEGKQEPAAKTQSAAGATTQAMLPSGEAAPKGWKRSQNSPGELQFRVDDSRGAQIGSASIAVVGPAMGEDNMTGRNKTVGGVPTTSLRRTVIDRMVRENGWVVNDFQKEIGGRRVYVVAAQSQATGGRVQSRMFYFAEVDGRIYSVATNASNDDAERLAEESEKVINSLQSRGRNVQQAAKE